MQTIDNTNLDRLSQTFKTKTKGLSLNTNGRQTTLNNEVVHDGHLMTTYGYDKVLYTPACDPAIKKIETGQKLRCTSSRERSATFMRGRLSARRLGEGVYSPGVLCASPFIHRPI